MPPVGLIYQKEEDSSSRITQIIANQRLYLFFKWHSEETVCRFRPAHLPTEFYSLGDDDNIDCDTYQRRTGPVGRSLAPPVVFHCLIYQILHYPSLLHY